MQKRVESVKEIDFSGLKVPFVAVYQHPEDFPEKCVARIYELDKPTDTLMVKDTLEEIEMDIRKKYRNDIHSQRGRGRPLSGGSMDVGRSRG